MINMYSYNVIVRLTGEVYDDPQKALRDYPSLSLKDIETSSVFYFGDLDEWLKESSSSSLELVYDPIKLIRSPDWDGSIESFDESTRNDKDFMLLVVSSPKWNGSCKLFSNCLFEDIDFMHIVLDSNKWDGVSKYFPIKLRLDEEITKKIINHSNWYGECIFLNEKYYVVS